MRRFAVLLVVLAACTKRDASLAPAPPVAPSAAVAEVPVDASTPDATDSTWPAALPVPTLPAAGPITADGYPAPVRKCLPDPAYLAGFSSDGELLGYCHTGMGTTCELLDRAGGHKRESAGGPEPTPAEGKKEEALDRAYRALGIPVLAEKDCNVLPNPLTGTWRFGDIRLKVVSVENSVVKVGGSVGGGPAVYPFIYTRPSKGDWSNGTHLNALALSPDGSEIGIVTHTNCMEWCDEFELVRMPVERFAAGIYNDAGFRAYKANDLESARALFLRAAYIDASHDLPAYNLACVYARAHDAAHAEPALKLAIARGGAAVRTRARADKDFAELKDAAWFTTLTAP